MHGDLDDPATLPAALKGVDAAYLATAPAPAPEMVRQALGKPVAHHRLDEQTLHTQLKSSGMPDWLIHSFDQWLAENKNPFAA